MLIARSCAKSSGWRAPVLGLALWLTTAGVAADAADPARLGAVVVTGTRSAHTLAGVPVDTVLITREDLERSPAQNLPQLLATLPGVSATNLDDTLAADNLRLTVRGLQLNEGYGLILVDGRRIHGGLGAHGDYGVSLNQIPIGMVERIEIVKGASSALYGADAMAGVINIITRKVPIEAGGTAAVAWGRYEMRPRGGVAAADPQRRDFRAHASYGAPVGEASGFLVLLSREQDEATDAIAQPTLRDALMARWNTAFGDHWSVELQADASRSRRDTVDPSQRFDRAYDDRRWSAALARETERDTWRLSGYRFSQDFEQGFPGFPHGHRQGTVGYDQVETQYTWLGDTHWVTLGAEHQRQDLDYEFSNFIGGELEATLPVERVVRASGVYLQDEIWLLDRRLVLVPGVRFEDHSEFGSELNPKLAASLRSEDERTTWRASVGRAFKSPTIRQLYYEGLYRHGEYYVESNPDLDPEKAINMNLSVERRWDGPRLWTSFGLFCTDLDDMVVRTATGRVTDDGFPIDSFVNVEKARIRGAELALRAGDERGLSVAVGAAWTDTENRDTGNELVYVPDYTLSLAPTWIDAAGRSGVRLALLAIGVQYRDLQNTQVIAAHRIVDLRAWRELTPRATLNFDIHNAFDSDKGDGEFAWRQGRRFGVSMDVRF
jgi:outer membrane receptor for ferrienterochelin and colicins